MNMGDLMKRAQEMIQSEMSKLTGGMNIPGAKIVTVSKTAIHTSTTWIMLVISWG